MKHDKVFDLCVIGAGMFGSAAARHASAEVGLSVCLIGPGEPTVDQRHSREIFSAHYDEGRITRVLDVSHPCQVMSKHSIKRYKEIEALSGLSFYEPVGCLFVGKRNEEYMLKFDEYAKIGDVPLVELKRETLQKRFPFMKFIPGEYAFFDDNGAGYISPRTLVEAQKKVAAMQGSRIIDSVVCDVKTLPDGLHEVVTETKGSVKAKRILIATGSFVNMKSFDVLKPLLLNRYKVTAAKVRITEHEANRLSSIPPILMRREYNTPDKKKFGAYILPPIKYPDGHYYIKIGPSVSDQQELKTLEDMKNWYLCDGDLEQVKSCSNFLMELLPGVDVEVQDISSLTCIECITPTGLPYIDRVSPTVTVAVGGNAKGAKFSDEVGRMAANLALKGCWDSELPKDLFKACFLH